MKQIFADKEQQLSDKEQKVIDENVDLGEKNKELAEKEEELAEARDDLRVAKQDVVDIKTKLLTLKRDIRDVMTPVTKDGKLNIDAVTMPSSRSQAILKLARIPDPEGGRLLDAILPTEMQKKFDDEDKVNKLRKLAKDGDTRAMRTLSGWIFSNMHGLTSNDYAEGLDWAKKGSDAGNYSSTARLGNYYRKGKGVQKNLGKALLYCLRAHEAGSTFAAFCLAKMYEDGELGLTKDPELALEFHSAVATNKIKDLIEDEVEQSAMYVAEHKKAC